MVTDRLEKQSGRRPLKVRKTQIAKNIAKTLSKINITPNGISIASVFFAALAALCLYCFPYYSGAKAGVLLLGAAIAIQCRLLCNLFDGMVAVEGGKKTPSGELFNDIPDRISDPLILVAAGYAITINDWGPWLGWLSAILAIMTAYIRTLSVSIGAPVDFRGPMAKQHRMAIMTIACLLSLIEELIWHHSYSLVIALILITTGCLVTIWRRSLAAYKYLETNS